MRDRHAILTGLLIFAAVLIAGRFASQLYTAIAWTYGGRGQGGANSDGYLIFSGPLGDLTLLTALIIFLRHNLCHVGGRWPSGCWRHGEDVEGTPYRACHKHHPAKGHRHGERITFAHIEEAWAKASRSKPAGLP